MNIKLIEKVDNVAGRDKTVRSGKPVFSIMVDN